MDGGPGPWGTATGIASRESHAGECSGHAGECSGHAGECSGHAGECNRAKTQGTSLDEPPDHGYLVGAGVGS
jgi:hypothetical protein